MDWSRFGHFAQEESHYYADHHADPCRFYLDESADEGFYAPTTWTPQPPGHYWYEQDAPFAVQEQNESYFYEDTFHDEPSQMYQGRPPPHLQQWSAPSSWLQQPSDPRDECVFCRIYDAKQDNHKVLFRNENIVVFPDHRPVAAHHLLAVSKQHIPDALSLTKYHKQLVVSLVEVGQRLLEERGGDVGDSVVGFHVPPKTSVSHLHLHLISPASTLSQGEKRRFGPHCSFFRPAHLLLQDFAHLPS